MPEAGTFNLEHDLNHCMNAAQRTQLGTTLVDVITNFNNFLAHVDAANVAGIGNTNQATYGLKTLGTRTPLSP